MRAVDQQKKTQMTRNRKHQLVRELGMYFAEKGKIVPAREYKVANDRPNFLTMKEIVKVMGSYTAAVEWIEKYEPELWGIIHQVEKVEEKEAPLAKLAQAKTGS